VHLGDPFEESTTTGRYHEPNAAKMDRHVADAVERGADVVIGGSRAAGFPTDLYREPTVLARVSEEMEVAREECFGPIVPVTTITSDAEALQVVNSSPYRLLAAVWTRDLARGLRFAEAADAGWVNINESTNYWKSDLPFGGRSGSQSGVGRVGGSSVLEAFTERRRSSSGSEPARSTHGPRLRSSRL
jgi:succinate-semialdehyde dehydrogenase/glutarate-semialdehyde dehydrogenase